MYHWSVKFPGHSSCLSEARRFAAKMLGDRPGVEVVQLVVSELAGNAIMHSDSGIVGGYFTLHLSELADRWRIRVTDAGGAKVPRLLSADPEWDEGGRGLALVAAMSSAWDVDGDGNARVVWAEVSMPVGDHNEWSRRQISL
jgi:serine/threonine-protein kinase RsbW